MDYKTSGISINCLLVLFLICAFAISPAFALGESNRNLLLIGIMTLTPLVVLRYLEFDRSDFFLLLFLTVYVLCPYLHQPDSIRWTTIGFSAMFCTSFMAFSRLLRNSDTDVDAMLNILKILIYAFTCMLLIQQICVLMHWPIINVSNYQPEEPWKLNGLTAEPSHSGVVVGLMMYAYITLKEIRSGESYALSTIFQEDIVIWLCFLWTMVTMLSGTAVVYLFLVLLKFVKGWRIIPLAIVFLAGFFLVESLEIISFERAFKVIKAVLTLNENTIVAADHSASFRIVPAMRYFKMIDFFSADTWFGHGVDYTQERFHTMFVGVEKGARAHGGLMITAIDFGLLPFLIFIVFAFSVFYRADKWHAILFGFLILSSNPINVQILWFSLMLFATIGWLRMKEESKMYTADSPENNISYNR